MVTPNRNNRIRERFNISKLAIQHSWLTLSFWIAVAVAGVLAFSSLQYALFPDITFPVVVVNASAPSKDALETEAQLTKPIEQQVTDLPGLRKVESKTYPGQSVVSLQFAVGTDLDQSTDRVETVLETLSLPEGTTSKVIPINLNESAVVSYAIESSTQNLTDLAKTAKSEILPALAQLPGVLKVNLLGEPIDFDLTQLTNPEALLSQGGTLVRINGREALAVQVIKRGDANTLEVVSAVKQEVDRLMANLPNVQFLIAATQADYIRAATRETIQALIEAIILSIVVIYPFLRSWQATLISALAIPMALLGTFIVMATYGFNLETITLLALAMVIGSIIDDAIVDVENISRHLEQGETPRQAAILATNEIGLTVTAATFTAVAVFLPVGMMRGVVGQFFKPFGITISAAMLTSLLVARTLSPLLAAYWLKPVKQDEPIDRDTGEGDRSFAQQWMTRINHTYRNWLAWSLRHRWIVILIALLSFVAGLALIPLIPKGFIPKLDRGEFNVTYTAPIPEITPDMIKALQQGAAAGNAPALSSSGSAQALPSQAAQQQRAQQQPGNPNLPNQNPAGFNRNPNAPNQNPNGLNQQANLPNQNPSAAPNQSNIVRAAQPPLNPLEASLQIAQQLDAFIRRSPEVRRVFTIVGSRQGEPNKGTLYVKLNNNRDFSTAEIQDQLRYRLPEIPDVKISVEDIQFVDTGGEKPLKLSIAGDNLTTLDQTVQKIKTQLEAIPGFVDVSVTGEANKADKIVEINRAGGQRVATISANLSQELTLGEATDRAVAIAKAIMPAGITLQLGGDSARIGEVLGGFGSTLTLSVLCIVLVLLFLFRSWLDTIVIFLSLPLSIVGAMMGLLVAQSDFGMISLIGIIFLLGLTNKNAILIVDYIKQLQRSGMSRREAILTASPVRLRPILMTTAATILGMLPLALGLGAGVELRAPMAIAIMGGLVTSTLLSLLVVPVIYDVLDGWRDRWGKRKK